MSGIERPWDAKPPPKPSKDGAKKWVFIILGAVALLLIVATCSTSSPKKPSNTGNTSTDSLKISAWVVCQQRVDEMLKAPASAGYPMMSEFPVSVSGSTYTMTAWVDSQNSFGAQIRTPFTCVATHTGGDMFNVRVSLS